MRAGAGKSKGGEWERDVCKKLSLWLTSGERQDCLWRSAMSGGRATVNRKRGVGNKTQCGDISAVSPEGHKLTDLFVIECKFYANLDLATSLLLGRGKLAQFWKEVCTEADKVNEHLPLDRNSVDRQPLLIARQNRFEPLLITTEYGINNFGLEDFVWCESHRMRGAHVCSFKALDEVECQL